MPSRSLIPTSKSNLSHQSQGHAQDSVVFIHEVLKRDRQLHGFSEARCAWPRPHALRRRAWLRLPAPLGQGPWLTPSPTCRH